MVARQPPPVTHGACFRLYWQLGVKGLQVTASRRALPGSVPRPCAQADVNLPLPSPVECSVVGDVDQCARGSCGGESLVLGNACGRLRVSNDRADPRE